MVDLKWTEVWLTNIKQLRKMIGELLLKIQNGKDGTDDEIAVSCL